MGEGVRGVKNSSFTNGTTMYVHSVCNAPLMPGFVTLLCLCRLSLLLLI